MDNECKSWDTEMLYRACKKWLAVFVAVMLGLTVVSRFLNTIAVPQVTVEAPMKAVLQYQTKGSGTLAAEETRTVPVLSKINVRKVIAGEGQTVSANTPLFAYQLDELQNLYGEQVRELEKLKLSLQSEQLSARPLPEMTEEELALQSLAKAERLLARSREKLGKAQAEYQEKAAELEEEYADDLKKNREDLTKARKKTYEDAEAAYELARLNKRLEVKTAAWEYETAVRELEQLEDEGASDSELQDAAKKADLADQNKEIVEDKWQYEVDKAQKDMDDACDDWQNLINGTEDIETALKKEYEEKLKKERDELETVQEALTDSSDSYEDARIALENARKKDSYTKTGIVREQELSILKQRSMELDIVEKEQEVGELKTLVEQDGIVYAPYSGVLTKLEFNSDSSLVQIGSGGILMKAVVDAEQAKSLTPEASVNLKKEGRNLSTTAVLKSLEADPDNGSVRLTAALSNTAMMPGTQVEFVCETKSPAYDLTIPIDALRQDNQGTYVLLVEERNTILGKELKAVRLNVTVLAKTTEKAAIEGGISTQDRIIVGSIKNIEAESTVRMVSE